MNGNAPGPKGAKSSLNTHELWELKDKLNSTHAVDRAFEIYQQRTHLEASASLSKRAVLHWQDYFDFDAEDCFLLEPGQENAYMPAPRSLGQKKIEPIVGRARPVFVACVRNARANAHTTAFQLETGEYIFDMQPSKGMKIDLSWETFVFRHEGDAIWCIENEENENAIVVQEAISLLGGHSENFGHWMIEHISQLLCFLEIPETRNCPILIDRGMPRQHRESLELIVGQEHKLIVVPQGQKVHCDKLWVCSTPIYSPKILWAAKDLSNLACTAELPARLMQKEWSKIDERLGIEPGGNEKLYLVRSPKAKRKLLNFEEVESHLSEIGFQTTRPEALSFEEQFRRLRQSDRIVIQTGSAMFGLHMCRPGTRVLFLTNGNVELLSSWNAVLQELGIDLTVVSGPSPKGQFPRADVADYSIPLHLLKEGLDSIGVTT